MKKILCLIISLSILCGCIPAFSMENGTVSWDIRKNKYKDYGLEMPLRPADKDMCEQNPPDFSWPWVDTAKSYNLVVARNEEMTDIAYEKSGITLNCYNFSEPFEAGTYYWSVQFETKDNQLSEWTEARRFSILPTAEPFISDSTEIMMEKLEKFNHPRIIVNEDNIEEIRKLSEGVSKEFYESLYKTAEKYLEGDIPSEPVCTSTEQAASMYKEVQTICGIIRICSFVHLISGEERFGKFAVNALLEMAGWDPEGATAYKWQDQAYREIVLNGAYGYDWTYNLMTETEKAKVLDMLKVRMKVMAEISIGITGEEEGTLQKLPYGSHNWTAFGYLLTASLATLGDLAESEDYLERGLPLYINVMAPWGGEDGGWAQGTGYWAASMTRHHDLNYTLKINDVVNIYNKAFFKNQIYYALYNTGKKGGASFGDGASGSVTPDMQLVIKAMSSMAGSEYAKWYYDYIGIDATNTYEKYFLADDSSVLPKSPAALPDAHHFADIGWTAHHSDMMDENRISLFFKSSPYGSYNHSHPDQNSFVIYAYGEPLAIDSGYFDSYWSHFDLGYTRKTYAHNTITYDGGKGQPIHSKTASGDITSFITHPDFDLVSGDATNAYTIKTSEATSADERVLDKASRHIIYLRPDMFIVIDDLKAKGEEKRKFEWWLNAYENIKFNEDKMSATIIKNKAQLDAEIVYPSDMKKGELLTSFSGPDKVECKPAGVYADSQIHQRVWFETPSLNKTKIVTAMGVHQIEKPEKSIQSEEKDNYISLNLENETYIYIKTDDSKEVVLKDGTKFEGAALVIKDSSVMLVDGTYLYMDGKEVIASDKNVSVAFGKDELEISSYEDSDIKLSIGNVKNIKNKAGIEIKENDNSFGISWTCKDDILSVKALKNNYSLVLNDDTGVSLKSIHKVTDSDGKDCMLIMCAFDYEPDNKPEDLGIMINGKKYSLIKEEKDRVLLAKAMDTKKFGIGIYDSNNLLGDSFVVIPYITVGDSDITGEAVTVIKGNYKSDNPYLKNLTTEDDAIFYPEFSEKTYDYYAVYPEGEMPSSLPGLLYSAYSKDAIIKETTENNKKIITVTSESGDIKTYTVTFAEYIDKILTADKMATKQTNQAYNSANNIDLPYIGTTAFNHHTTLKTTVSDIGGQSIIRHFNFNIKDENGNYVMPDEFVMLNAELSLYARSDTIAYETPGYTTMVISKTTEDWTKEDFAKASGQRIASEKLTEVEIYTKNTTVSNYKLTKSYNFYNISLEPEEFTKNTDLMLSFHKKEVHTEGGFKDCPRILIGNAGPVSLKVRYINK